MTMIGHVTLFFLAGFAQYLFASSGKHPAAALFLVGLAIAGVYFLGWVALITTGVGAFIGSKVYFSVARNKRDGESARQELPTCGAVLLYRQENDEDVEFYGEFEFPSQDVETAIAGPSGGRPQSKEERENTILNWLRSRNDALLAPTAVPRAWTRFYLVADDLLRNGVGSARCMKCQAVVPLGQLVAQDDRGKAGWNYDRLLCSNGHLLLRIPRISISKR